jgi:hypothetical protein
MSQLESTTIQIHSQKVTSGVTRRKPRRSRKQLDDTTGQRRFPKQSSQEESSLSQSPALEDSTDGVAGILKRKLDLETGGDTIRPSSKPMASLNLKDNARATLQCSDEGHISDVGTQTPWEDEDTEDEGRRAAKGQGALVAPIHSDEGHNSDIGTQTPWEDEEEGGGATKGES